MAAEAVADNWRSFVVWSLRTLAVAGLGIVLGGVIGGALGAAFIEPGPYSEPFVQGAAMGAGNGLLPALIPAVPAAWHLLLYAIASIAEAVRGPK